MASISSRLSPKDKMALATFFETDAYGSLKKLFKLIKTNTADSTLNAIDMHNLKWLQGQHVAIEKLEKEMEIIHTWSKKH